MLSRLDGPRRVGREHWVRKNNQLDIDFHALTNALYDLQVLINDKWMEEVHPLITWKKRLLGGPKFGGERS